MGDPACWLGGTCLACGRVVEPDETGSCRACGWPLDSSGDGRGELTHHGVVDIAEPKGSTSER